VIGLRAEEVGRIAGEAAEFLVGALGEAPGVAIVLGTGWDGLVEGHAVTGGVGFGEIPGFASAGCPGHRGDVSVIETASGRILVQSGRLHCYEGLTPLEVSFPMWAYAAMGVKSVILTCAGGGLNPAYSPGDLIVVADHINLFGSDPLAGIRDESGSGDCFVFEADYYTEDWMQRVEMALPPTVQAERGVYAYNGGPSFETGAEAMMLRLCGADAVGMSMTMEAVAAGHLRMGLAGLCCISNTLLPTRTKGVSSESIISGVRRTVSMMDGFLEAIASQVM
jgi:purine-nucleoside phosphorylase